MASAAYYEGLNEKLLRSLPPAKKVLEFGCASGILGQRYKELHPTASWHGVDIHAESLEVASKRLDRVWKVDVDNADFSVLEDGYDCVVIGDVLEHLKAPERLLVALGNLTTRDAQLVCCIPNMSHISIAERILMGDLVYDDNGLMDRTHLRFFSQSSIFKLFLDCGWLPNLQDTYFVGHPNKEFANSLIECAKGLRVSQEAAERFLFSYQLIITCIRHEAQNSSVTVPISVIVPVNNEAQFALNLARSPGLREIGAELLPCREAKTAADAFAQGRSRARGDWLLYCHQDVYFPSGSGFALSRALSNSSDQADMALIGFAGIGTESETDPYTKNFNAGLVVDRSHCYNWPATNKAVSLDEFAIVVHRQTRLSIDPAMGWHLWATDLCLQVLRSEENVYPKIIRVPVYHNSFSDHTLPHSFHESSAKLAAKYPDVLGIHTLCAQVS